MILDSGATLNVLKTDTWKDIKEYHKLQLKASTIVLSAANNSKLQSNGTIQLTLYPDVTENRTLRNTFFILTFHVANAKFNILGTPFLEKFVEQIKCSSHTKEIKQNRESKLLNFYDSSTKSPPYYSRLFAVIGDQMLDFQLFEHRILT